MKTVKEQLEFRDKLLAGLDKAYEKLIEYKKRAGRHERRQNYAHQAGVEFSPLPIRSTSAKNAINSLNEKYVSQSSGAWPCSLSEMM